MDKKLFELPQIVFTAGETAALLKVTEKTVYRLVERQRLHAVKSIRHLRITKKSLEEFLTSTSGKGGICE
jgi:excisionase family DNA binding protein